MSKTAFIFPGQASQKVGMGRDLYVNYVSAREVFADANDGFRQNLKDVIFDGTQSELDSTANAQPAVAAVSIAAWRAMEEACGFMQLPAMVAGHSLGEYSSLAVSGVLSVSDTMGLVAERGRLMQLACTQNPGGMVALIGIEESAVADICRQTGTQISNINSPNQIIISGRKNSLVQATDLAGARGARKVIQLPVSGAFHSNLMRPIQEQLECFIDTLDFQDPLMPMIGNVDALPLLTAKAIKQELKAQLQSCVRWRDSIRYMAANGVTKFIEIGPGRTLSSMVSRIVPDATVLNVEDYSTVRRYLEAA